jgi:DNA-binding winged helix-turn-helix (wHTH) protein/tetratricopeptide (TPR) repeat protein
MNSARFYEYSIDRLRCVLEWREQPVPINRKTFDLLLYLIDHRHRLVTKDELLENLWPDQFVEESNLTQHVFLLRKALSAQGGDQKIIQTVSRRGYRFTAPLDEDQVPAERMVLSATESITRVTVEEEEEMALVASTPASLGSALGIGSRFGPVLAWSFAVLFLGLAGWFGWQRWLDKTGGPPVDVVLAPMTGGTGDPVLDQALVAALRMDLSQSPFVSLVSPARVRATLTEMKQNPDAPISSTVARDVCERTNSQAILQGNVARAGQHFLLTEEATSCVNGAVLAEAKQEASATEDLPHSIDKLAESVRRKLGESRRSVARFDTPLFSSNTASLEALKYYSQASVQSNQGKYLDAIELLKKAVAADPNFTAAYYDLAAYYRSTMDPAAEREAILKAYSLRDSASEPIRLAITALYHSSATQDLYEAERNYRSWTELYPRAVLAWNGLAVVERDLGHNTEAVVADRRALDLRPAILGLYVNLAHDQNETGDIKGAIATCEQAIGRGLDGDYIRQPYLKAAFSLHDAELVQKQRDWEAAHPDAVFIRAEEVELALDEGRFSDAHRMLPQTVAIMKRLGMGAPSDFIWSEVLNLMEAGDTAEATRLFRSVPVDPNNELGVVGLARVGDFAQAESALRARQAEFPKGTLWNDYHGPEVEATIALAAHRPKDAIAALERIRPLEGRTPFITLQRANAYLANGEPELAEKSYRSIVEGPLQSEETVEIPLSWLGLGRALAAEGKRDPAIEAYQHFLMLWSHADADATFLVQARSELKALQTPAPTK